MCYLFSKKVPQAWIKNRNLCILCYLWERALWCIGVWVSWECLYTNFVSSIFVSEFFFSSLPMDVGQRPNHINSWRPLLCLIVHCSFKFSSFLLFLLEIFLKCIIVSLSILFGSAFGGPFAQHLSRWIMMAHGNMKPASNDWHIPIHNINLRNHLVYKS